MQEFFNKLPTTTLRGKFLSFNIPIMLLALTCVFMVFGAVDYHQSMETFNDRVGYLMEANQTNLGIALKGKHHDLQKSIITQIAKDPTVRAVYVYDTNKHLILKKENHFKKNEHFLSEHTDDIFYVDNYMGTLKIIASAKYHLHQVAQRLLLDLYLSLFAVLVVTLGSLIINRYTIDIPLAKMLDAIELTNSTKMNHTVSWESRDEIGSVVSAFNEMQLQIQQQTDMLKVSRAEAIAGNTAKSEFIANISHELRTPLHVIVGLAKLGLKNIDGWSHAKLRDAFNDITVSSDRLLKLVNELLDISKLEAGKMSFEFSQHNMINVTEWVLRELGPLIQEKGIVLQINYAKQESLYGIFDYAKIGQVIRNLLSNAIKFSHVGGVINIQVTSDPQQLSFSISDNGIGIPPNEQDKIFEKFVQSSKTKTGAGGTGLGLAISKEIISMHYGTITATSNAIQTTFMFTIPREPRR